MGQISVVSIYVSHNSDEYIKKFSDRHKDELGEKVFLINSSSNTIEPENFYDFEVINIGENIGFSAANNIGIKNAAMLEPDYYLIINPDVYLPPSWLNRVLEVIQKIHSSDIGIFTVPLIAYDFAADKQQDVIDSLGLSHTWYGRWFDIKQGENIDRLDECLPPYEVQAACGALMLIQRDVVCELLKKDGYVFNESYFMYKEDIELSVRVRELGRKIIMIPSEHAFHCRGWAGNRADSPYWARELSARNELRMHFKYYKRFLPYSILKYFYVRFFETFKFKIARFLK